MKRFFRFNLLFSCLLLFMATKTPAQEDSTLYIPQAWGLVFGTADTTDDFLIYDACIPQFDSGLILIVGKSQKADAFATKQTDKAYFYEKDDDTDAFLACFSTRGQYLWSTYLPAPDKNHLLGFASCVRGFDSSFIVIANAYRIDISTEFTRASIPEAEGNFRFFEFSPDGSLLRSATFTPRQYNTQMESGRNFPYVPRILSINKSDDTTYSISGHCLMARGQYSVHGAGFFCSFSFHSNWKERQLNTNDRGYSEYSNQVEYWLNPSEAFNTSFLHSVDLYPHIYFSCGTPGSSRPLSNAPTQNAAKDNDTVLPFNAYTFPLGHNLQHSPLFMEQWLLDGRFWKGNDYFYGSPLLTRRRSVNGYDSTGIFSGSVQNTRTIQDYIVVQGIHCKDYFNGFLWHKDTTPCRYSHDTNRMPPSTPGRLQTRNPSYTAVPFLLLYKQNLLGGDAVPKPEWGAYLHADWFYQDLLASIDLREPKNYYMPSIPALLATENRFFLIGNAKTIDQDNIRGFFSHEKPQSGAHHQGFLTAFQLGCPPAWAHFQPTDKLCMEDSVALIVDAEYDGYLFAFSNELLQNGSISVSADSTQAWAKKPGRYHATLLSRIDGCEDAQTDTIEVLSYGLDTNGNRFLPKDSILCAHLDIDFHLPDNDPEGFRYSWLDREGIVLPFGQDTNRFTINGLKGTDGFGAGTDSRQPRFFQLRLVHKICQQAVLDTLLVYDVVKPSLELPFHDTLICFDEPVLLDSLPNTVYKNLYRYVWNTGKEGSDFSFSDSGTYTLHFFVKEEFNFCGYDTASDSVHVLWSDPALTLISIPEDTAFCENRSIFLDASVPYPSTRYSWQEGMLDNLFLPTEDSTLFTSAFIEEDRNVSYGLFLLDTLGCLNSRQINISEEDCRPKLEIPNVFTPNGDGVNDVWKFTQLEKCYQVDILVVDRKGNHVLHQKVRNADDFSWNGCFKNGSHKMPDGAYFYMVTYKDAYGKNKVQSGSVTILGTAE